MGKVANGWKKVMSMDSLQNHCSDRFTWVVCSCSAESKVCMTICKYILKNKIVNSM